MKRVIVLGSTGSIGTQTLDVLAQMRDQFRVVGLGAGHLSPAFETQVAAWAPEAAALSAETKPPDLDAKIFVGADALVQLVEETDPDIVILGTPGLVGLAACLKALEAGRLVGVANKETLVSAGAIVMATARRCGGTIVPVDSEHSGVWQCLRGEEPSTVRRIIITSSGGALRDMPLEEIAEATTTQVLKHPTWSMGPKITVDSATLMNKGLEIIEASWLFDVPTDRVDVILHRQSIVHALVEFCDASIKAQLAVPDMRLPIVNALTYPDRPQAELPRLDVATLGALTFEPIDPRRYPAVGVAREAAAAGGLAPAVLNAANEVAVERFLAGEIRFSDIVPLVEATLDRHNDVQGETLVELLQVDASARATCRSLDVR
ncbi:MAG: 1-deoxy-D-xylulose-5-phosphate reductoisomerase [Chloroflexota bacterium]|jgi:1-deoxy-D-xylulose-5-phosphate reductoisomerase|nr:1-deoxy-D-xylulose-5-phosphate reductoisomerase [Chloroflexota bacterium]